MIRYFIEKDKNGTGRAYQTDTEGQHYQFVNNVVNGMINDFLNHFGVVEATKKEVEEFLNAQKERKNNRQSYIGLSIEPLEKCRIFNDCEHFEDREKVHVNGKTYAIKRKEEDYV